MLLAKLCTSLRIATAAALMVSIQHSPVNAQMRAAPGLEMTKIINFAVSGQTPPSFGGPEKEYRVSKLDFKQATVNVNGQIRDFYYYVPYGGDINRPLVIGFHGGGGKANEFGDRMGLKEMADTLGYVIALPQGVGRSSSGGSWNANSITGLDYSEKQNTDDIAFAKAVMEEMRTIAVYDPTRVYALGMSKGGMMAYHLACQIQDSIKAIAVVAGTFASVDCPGGDASLLVIHGTDDQNVPFEGGAGELSRQGADWPPVPRGIDLYTEKNVCSENPSSKQISSDTSCDVYACAGEDAVEVCLVEEGGHAWPGVKPASWQKQNDVYVTQSFNATDYIGAFFEQH